jgi:tetratricopeptide repeat protein 21B
LSLWLTLADLFMKLQRYDAAIATCAKATEELGDSESIETMMSRTKLLLLQAQVYKRAGNGESYAKCLSDANEMQGMIVARLRGDSADLGKAQRRLAADICAELAKFHEQHKRYKDALAFYNTALNNDKLHAEARISLAKLHMDRDELEEATKQCEALLKHDLEAETAKMMLADIKFRSNDFEQSIRYFAQLLELKPNNYKALEQLILLVRRAGKLHQTSSNRPSDALSFIRLAERSSARAVLDGGFHFCKGIYARYTRNFPEALEELNQARKDGEWGPKAICHMIEIYLDPEQLGGELNTGPMVEPDKVKMSRQLRQELSVATRMSATKLRLYEAYEFLMIQHIKTVEQAVNLFTEILKDDQDSVAALLGLSYALRLLKQDAKARNHLKRISKMQYNSEEAEEMEQSYLLLAEGYIQSNKNDLAQELCHKCLAHNKSCSKAWEFQGLIYEKEASYADAAQVNAFPRNPLFQPRTFNTPSPDPNPRLPRP